MGVLRHILSLVIVLLLQMLVFNNLHFLGICHPYIYILFLIALPIRIPQWIELLIGFGVGLIVDMFCGSPGVHTAACSFLAYLRPIFIRRTIQDAERISMTIDGLSIGFNEYVKLVVLYTILHHTLVFLIEAWSLAHFWLLLAKIIVSSLFTIALLLFYDRIKQL
ncbi:MAG: rod shape-determining protein MreD [Paludibacteraceae bacterium]|jgi:rod shape-determining protein MreD|nr:rod shape-determining protein MreD [Paludibacteraceae bacterium]